MPQPCSPFRLNQERENHWNSLAPAPARGDLSPASPAASWNAWDFHKRDKTGGVEPCSPTSPRPTGLQSDCRTPKRQGTSSSKFDEWAKRKEEQRFEEAKEEEGSRKQKDMDPNSGDKERTSLLNDKAVAMGLVSKKAVTDLNSIRRIYMDFDADGSGLIEPPEFMPLLSKEVWAVWDQVDSDGSGTIDFDEFQRWYAELMGIDAWTGQGEELRTKKFIPEEISGDQIMVRNVAKNLNRSILEVEKLYDEFKKLDTDNSNTLEMNEIQKEFAPKGPEVPEHVFKMFWKDFDKDGRGSVTFVDFCTWYLKFMKGDSSPMEQYFAYMSATPGAR
eukprot:g15336.t1